MKTKISLSFLLVVILITIGVFFLGRDKSVDFANSPLNAEYKIEGRLVKLKNGKSEIESDINSTSKIITSYFGNEVRRDFDLDGREDSVFLITQETGGSGVFYYVVPALNTANGYVGGEALFLGDRIAPQTTEIGKNNIVIVNFADRKPEESFAIAPSVGKTIWLKFDPKTLQFSEVVQDFEGEADPSKMTLSMKTWTWVFTLYSDDREIKPNTEGIFNITFGNDGRFSLKTDCNSVSGKYTVNDKKISFSQMASTKMYCENSQETQFRDMLTRVQHYLFTSKGELVLNLAFDSGSVVFK